MDRWGRRAGMFVGAFNIVVGSIIQATSNKLPQFIVGRFIVGFGNPMCATTAAVYLVEMSYPTWRGLAGGLYNVLGWNIGANSAYIPNAKNRSTYPLTLISQLPLGPATAPTTLRMTGAGGFPTSSSSCSRPSSSP